jgi:hypothetical protein
MAAYEIALVSFMSVLRRAAQVQSPPSSFYSPVTGHPFGHVAELLLFAPIFETFVLIVIFELVRWAGAPAIVQVLTAAIFISELHVWPWWPHGLIVFPAFLIDAAVYRHWRGKGSWKSAFVVVALIHALCNLIPAVASIGYGLRTA